MSFCLEGGQETLQWDRRWRGALSSQKPLGLCKGSLLVARSGRISLVPWMASAPRPGTRSSGGALWDEQRKVLLSQWLAQNARTTSARSPVECTTPGNTKLSKRGKWLFYEFLWRNYFQISSQMKSYSKSYYTIWELLWWKCLCMVVRGVDFIDPHPTHLDSPFTLFLAFLSNLKSLENTI